MSWKDKLKLGIQKQLDPKTLLQYLCPFEVSFKLKIFAKVKGHDFALLFQAEGDKPFFEDPKDLESLITQIMSTRKSDLKMQVTEVRYDKETYMCLYLDFPKEEKKLENETKDEKKT